MKDMTQGSPGKIMLRFAFPVAAGNIFQMFYSLADIRVVGSTLGVTMANFCGQNMGTGKISRIRSGIFQALILTSVWSVAMIFLSYTIAPFLVYLVTGSLNPDIAGTAALYLKINSLFYFVPAAISIFRNTLQGCGDHKTPVLSSFIEPAGKVLIAAFLTPVLKYMGVIIAEPIVWILMVIPLTLKIRKL